MPVRALFFFLLLQLCASIDTITPTNPLKEGEFLTSKGGKFTLGFFSPGNSSQRYIGLWFTKVSQTVVWVANRDKPINDLNGILSINEDGNLIISSNKSIIWSTNISVPVVPNATYNITSCQLLNSGNLVLVLNKNKSMVWQSFDHQTDVMLPGATIGLDKRIGLSRYLTSWRATDDPSPGNYSFWLDPKGSPQFFFYRGSEPLWRGGPWNGIKFNGIPEETHNYVLNYSYVSDKDEVSYTYTVLDETLITIFAIDTLTGQMQRSTWDENGRRWVRMWSDPKDLCDQYGQCGNYGSCNPNSGNQFICSCYPGYKPKSQRSWYIRDGSQGCVREQNMSMCKNGEGFLKFPHVKVPDTSKAKVNTSMTLKECEEECLRNCSCLAYTAADQRGGGSGCIAIDQQLIDTRLYVEGGQDIYYRVDAITLAKYRTSKALFANKRREAVVIAGVLLIFTMLVTVAWFWVHKRRREWEEENERALWTKDSEESGTDSELPFFTRREIVKATNNFSLANKLGQGGFGSVFKGQLLDGQEIAVKKLAQTSGQGIKEFKNEVRLIAKLQHRNLVKMLGCCIRGAEKMLIYEFMPNKSLDNFIFKEENRSSLNWRKRFDIILGIARGMLYLHQDSRLRIIHRDLKASNVLLDKDMVPKIADFGMARIFWGNEEETNTTRVVGTFGYMAPEYALEGLISVKSDVFSFGILLLEIVTGRKNLDRHFNDPLVNLIGHVWQLWKDGKALDIVDPAMTDTNIEELSKCIQIGLLCVQEQAIDRPIMSAVVFMLSNKMEVPSPNQPAFIHRRNLLDVDPCSSSGGTHSINEMSFTSVVKGR